MMLDNIPGVSPQVPITLTACSDCKFQNKVLGATYAAMINPESLTIDYPIDYNAEQAEGTNGANQKFAKTPPQELSFDLLLDCTGVVDATRISLPDEINQIMSIVYTYNGNIHRPNFVQLCWGSNFVFNGVMKAVKVNYTLFRPDGTPLRAKLSFTFVYSVDAATSNLLAGNRSPDLTHQKNLEQGQHLAQLCNDVYSTPDIVVKLAKANKLNKFRHLKGGEQLLFPPLVNPSAKSQRVKHG